ncbi:hypothetical protein GCM10009662_07090 [Catellatospora coxensis]|uniref:Uncharacterized protein n=1 Tax=Catellatospora coxensis TaxID=310354 RepID=A0A8J3PBD7_9ACTN|nr:hypothetical protein Cco03nite_72340 [Catellatospora coxensis]
MQIQCRAVEGAAAHTNPDASAAPGVPPTRPSQQSAHHRSLFPWGASHGKETAITINELVDYV